MSTDPTPGAARPPGVSRTSVVTNLTYEIVPLRSADAAIAALPAQSAVSVTCSPVKGLAPTQELTDRVRNAGHLAIPHLAARLVEGPAHVAALARWLRTEDVRVIFVIGGDADEPVGPYGDSTTFLRDLLTADAGVSTVGVASYPDGHPLIPQNAIDGSLRAKQQLLDQAGINGWTSTQMCFDPDRIVTWAERERAAGLHLPIHLGLPGVVERTKLMSMGMRLGVGTSLRYLRKNAKTVGRLMARSDYDPDDLVTPLSPHLARLGITGIHCFTFNQVEATAAWQAAVLGS
jgi:methylenetetrahydrofolate reductase (NADPH)